MAVLGASLEVLSTRQGFNTAVRHIKRALAVIESLATTENLADLLEEYSDEEVTLQEKAYLLRMILVDKLGYTSVSLNIKNSIEKPERFADEFSTWKAVDLVFAYYHPDLGLQILNPKNSQQLAALGEFKKNELLVIYVGKGSKGADELCTKAALIASSLLQGETVKIPEDVYKGPFTYSQKNIGAKALATKSGEKAGKRKTAAPAPAQEKTRKKAVEKTLSVAATQKTTEMAKAPTQSGGRRMTPLYSVVVQNELFHNGNVEAWKRIIESYKAKYPDLEVYIYYEGERIMNINSLFKWGKVKHGSTIQFAVAGSDIKDVAKLQRYLMQGASPRFEAFLKGPVSTVLSLF
ncbi:MAG: hypothetical protein SNJ56_01245 [Termitinemataceae bacterium]